MSLGGKTVEKQQIDPALRDAALAQLDMARRVGQLGFVPYKGDTVAGFQPGQIAAMQNTNAGLDAFGLNTSAVPTGGNLSPYAIYQQQLAQMDPGQRAFIDSMFINPMTGAAPTMQFGVPPVAPVPTPAPVAPVASGGGGGGGGGGGAAATAAAATSGGGGNRSTTSIATPASYLPGGVNTRNPGSIANTLAAQLTSKPKGPTAPTSSPRPISRSTGAVATAGTKPANSANKRTGGGSGSMSTAATNAAAKAAADKKAADAKAAEKKAADERKARDRIAAAERSRSASNRAAANKSTRDAAQGKGGKSGPSSGGNRSSGGSNATRR